MHANADLGLIEKIEQLPPDKRVEVEDFVDFLRGRLPLGADGQASGERTLKDHLLAPVPRSEDFAAAEPGATVNRRETIVLD